MVFVRKPIMLRKIVTLEIRSVVQFARNLTMQNRIAFKEIRIKVIVKIKVRIKVKIKCLFLLELM